MSFLRSSCIAVCLLAVACIHQPSVPPTSETGKQVEEKPTAKGAGQPETLSKDEVVPEPAPEPVPEPAGEVVVDTCGRIAAKLASVRLDECVGLGLRESGHRSVAGTPVLMAEFPPLEKRQPLGRVLLIGGVHGDELSSISIVFKWLGKLKEHHSGLFHWVVAPLANPDGALMAKAQRVNANGVDLNRNLPTANWVQDSRDYWRRTQQNPRRYPGPAPASEPETRWLVQQIERFQPDVIVSVHSPHQLVDYDAPSRREAPQKIGMLQRNFLGTYPGSLGNYAGLHRGIPVVTLELPHSWYLPKPAQITHMWVDLVRWLRENVPNARRQRLARFGGAKAAD